MDGEAREPYRLPCFLGAWPTTPTLALCSPQHHRDDEMQVPEQCNVGWVGTPTYLTSCAAGQTYADGNCYATLACVTGSVVGVKTTAQTYAAGATEIYLSAGCGTILDGDFVLIEGDPVPHRVAGGVAASCDLGANALSGYTLYLEDGLARALNTGPVGTRVPLAVTIQPRGERDMAACHKWGWKAVRAYVPWDGRGGWLAGDKLGCMDAPGPNNAPSCLQAAKTAWEEAVAACAGGEVCIQTADRAFYDAIGACANACPECDTSTTRYLRVEREATYQATNTLPDGMDDTEQTLVFGRQVSRTTGLVALDPCIEPEDAPSGWFAKMLLGVFYSDAAIDDFFRVYFVLARYTQAPITRQSTSGEVSLTWTFAVTLTDTVSEQSYEVVSPTGTYRWASTWTLSAPLALATVLAEAYGMLNETDLSDDLLYPWRRRNYGPWNLGWGGNSHLPVPLRKRRRLWGGINPDDGVWNCETADPCPAPCPHDGFQQGVMLPPATGRAYAFADAYGVLANLGWNPGYELPDNATYWTAHVVGQAVGGASLADYTEFPPGGWVKVQGGDVYVQKWAETRERVPSKNFFRPCGADREDHPDAWPLCGRVGVESLDAGGDVVTVTLAEEAPGLEVGDSVALVRYAGETAVVVATVAVATLPDARHFTYEGELPAVEPEDMPTHARSPGAPAYHWHDDLPKGDAVFCASDYNYCTGAAAPTCVDACTQYSPCVPQVLAVLPPGYTEQWPTGAKFTLPDEVNYRSGVFYRVSPRGDEPDPLWVYDPFQPTVVAGRQESRCARPPGAPTGGGAYQGCAESGESAPEMARAAAEPTTSEPGCPGCGPTLGRQAMNLAGAVGRTAGRWLRGERVLADEKQAAPRLATCVECDRLADGRCLECGCFVRAKAKLAAEQCPLARWTE